MVLPSIVPVASEITNPPPDEDAVLSATVVSVSVKVGPPSAM